MIDRLVGFVDFSSLDKKRSWRGREGEGKARETRSVGVGVGRRKRGDGQKLGGIAKRTETQDVDEKHFLGLSPIDSSSSMFFPRLASSLKSSLNLHLSMVPGKRIPQGLAHTLPPSPPSTRPLTPSHSPLSRQLETTSIKRQKGSKTSCSWRNAWALRHRTSEGPNVHNQQENHTKVARHWCLFHMQGRWDWWRVAARGRSKAFFLSISFPFVKLWSTLFSRSRRMMRGEFELDGGVDYRLGCVKGGTTGLVPWLGVRFRTKEWKKSWTSH